MLTHSFETLAKEIEGEFFYDESTAHQTQLLAYSTDASVYQEKPVAVALQKTDSDIR